MRNAVFLLAPLAIAACSFSLGEESKGQNGRLAFNYQTSDCLFGCAVESAVAEGSMITIQATGVDPNTAYAVNVDPPSAGTVVLRTTCNCSSSNSNGTSSSSVEPSGTCAAGATKACSLNADIETLASGSARLNVTDPKGALVDWIPFTIAKADRVTSTVSINRQPAKPGPDGMIVAKVGDAISVHSDVTSGGKKLTFTEHGLLPTYSDSTVVGSYSELFGGTDTETATAKGEGSATLTLAARGAEAVVRFRIAR